MSIGTILRSKPQRILSVPPTMTIEDVSRELAAHRVGALLVTDSAGQLLGILSERDVARALSVHGANTLTMTAAQLMTETVYTVTPETKVRAAMEMMTNGRVRHLPVIDGGTLVGLVSIGDVVKQRLDQQAAEVDSLREYVSGQG